MARVTLPAPVQVLHGDMLDVLADLEPASVDSVVCDPPYGLAFMGRGWDHQVPGPDYWTACLRVLKPGGHLLAFGGTRTFYRLAVAIEDAGFEIRDTITWLYGSGFPKSLDVSKAIDKAAGVEREVVGSKMGQPGYTLSGGTDSGSAFGAGLTSKTVEQRIAETAITAPATDAARRWQGFGTALKPASEPIIVVRKPITGTVAANVQAYGTGALNIDGCRVEGDVPSVPRGAFSGSNNNMHMGGRNGTMSEPHAQGRWPSNVVLTHAEDCRPPNPSAEDIAHDKALAELQGREYVPWPGELGERGGCVDGCPVAELDAQSGNVGAAAPVKGTERSAAVEPGTITGARRRVAGAFHGDSGGASRFFPVFRYQAKAPTRERPKVDGVAHPTVKPLALMRWLVRLVTPPGGVVLDPFAGSGTTGEAAVLEGMRAILVESESDYLPLIAARLERVAS